MTKLPTLWLLSPLLALHACAGAPEPDRDPAIEEGFREREQQAEIITSRRESIERVLSDLDKTLDKYAEAVMSMGGSKSINRVDRLKEFIYRTADKHFDQLVAAADDTAFPRNQAISVAALGFSKNPAALDPLLNAAGSDNQEVANNAVFGLAELGDPRTPPAAIARVMNDPEQPMRARAGAAWALYKLQTNAIDTAPIVTIWRELVARPIDETDPTVLVSALRGLGLNRSADDAALIRPYVSHPKPLVREVAAIALGRSGDAESVESLLTLIGTAESNENVRLAARKALQELAGGEDRGYEVQAWRSLFERER